MKLAPALCRSPSRAANRFAIVVALLAAISSSTHAADDAATIGKTLPELSGNGFVVKNVRVFDGTRTIAKTDVVVVDGRIRSVGPARDGGAGLPVVDGTGRTLLPGLVDAHTHTYGNARADALRFGVTTELDMFTDWHLIADARVQRAALGRVREADLWSAGTLATVPHGHGTEYGFAIPTLTTPAEAQPFVDARLAEGSDYLKIILEDGSAYGHVIATLDTPTLNALVAAAHARGRLAVAHVATEDDARRAVDAGIDGLAHVFMDRPADAPAIASIKAHRTFVVATLSVAATAGGAGEGAKLAADPRLRPWLSPDQVRVLDAGFPSGWSKASLFANATDSVTRLHRAGVTIVAGTDAGNPGTTHGATLHQELALLVRAGLTPTEALAAATAVPARLFALGDRGRIAAGLRADLLLVDGDPTRDIGATRAIAAIWKNGYLVDRTVAPVAAAGGSGPIPTDPVIADFEDGAIATRYGQNWIVTTDQLAGGKSTATQTWIADGAQGSKGAMRIAGTVAPGSPFPWAGSLFMPGDAPFAPADYSGRAMLTFRVRGDARENVAMLFSGPPSNGAPLMVRFKVTPTWTDVRIPLSQFNGADLSRVRGIAFTAGAPAGDFAFDLDDVAVQ